MQNQDRTLPTPTIDASSEDSGYFNATANLHSVFDWLDAASDAVATVGTNVMESLTDMSRPALVAVGLEYPEVVQEAVRNQDSPLRADSQNIVGHSFDSKDSMVEADSAELPGESANACDGNVSKDAAREDVKPNEAAKAKVVVAKAIPALAPPRRSPRGGRNDSSVRSPSPQPRSTATRQAAVAQPIRDSIHPTRGKI